MISVKDLRASTVFEEQGQYFLVLNYEHIKMGRGGGIVKVKVRNLGNGSTVEKSFNTGGRVQESNLNRKKVQYLYKLERQCYLMDMQTYEQFAVDEVIIGDLSKFLKEGMELTLYIVDDRPLYVEVPKILDYKVAQTGGADRGNTVGSTYKDAILENGLTVKVPLFIKTGELIRVDTRSGQYVERA